MKKLFMIFLMVFAIGTLVSCDKKDPKPKEPDTPTPTKKDDLSKEVALNVAINYTTSNQLYSITYQKSDKYLSSINGKEYQKGALLPVWEAIGEKLNIKFTDKAVASDTSTDAQFTRMQQENFAGVDLINGTGANIGTAGTKDGQFVDINKYIDEVNMPNLKKFLDDNPSIRSSITSGDGGIYFTPYFDGVNELEHMYLARIDWIEKILDSENTNLFSTEAYTMGTNYQKITPAGAETYKVTVPNVKLVDGKQVIQTPATREVNKSRTKNVLDVLSEVEVKTGKSLAEAFIGYLNDTYGDNKGGYEKLSHIFSGADASYDTDELIALFHVIKANQSYLLSGVTGVTGIEIYFPREKGGNRIRQMFRGLEMFGLRGVSSRHQWAFIDSDDTVQDIRAGKHVDSFISGVNNLSALVKDGLIPDVSSFTGTNIRKELLEGSAGKFGFITYDYNASSTASSLINTGKGKDPNMKFEAILPPVLKWNDGDDSTGYYHFSESVRSVKNEAWGIPKHVEQNQEKLYRALTLVDQLYDYSATDSVGTIHLYGPTGWQDGTKITYGNDNVYKLSDKALEEMNTLGGGNMINYLRWYVGATMPIGHIRSLGLEYQTLSPNGIDGIERINTAVSAGTFKLAGQYESTNSWSKLIPTFFPFNQVEETALSLNSNFRAETADAKLLALMNNGFSGNNETKTVEQYKEIIASDKFDQLYYIIYQDAYARTKK